MIDTRGNLIEMSKEMQLFNASLVFDHQQLRYRGTSFVCLFVFLEERDFLDMTKRQ